MIDRPLSVASLREALQEWHPAGRASLGLFLSAIGAYFITYLPLIATGMPAQIVFDPIMIAIGFAFLIVLNLVALATRRLLLTTAILCGIAVIYLLSIFLGPISRGDWGWLGQAYLYVAMIGLNGFFMDRWQKAFAE